jgi:cell division protein FtsB
MVISALFALIVSTISYYRENGYADNQELQAAIADLEAKVEAVKEDNRRLAKERVSLVGDDHEIEAIARQDLGLVRPDEVVYEFIDRDKLIAPVRPTALENAGQVSTDAPAR